MDAEVADVELAWLASAKRDAVVDALAAGHELPIVLVEDEVACTDQIDLDAVVALATRIADKA